MKKLESTFLNMTVVLTCITLIAAAGTAAVFNFTQKPIADAKQAKQEAAIKVVMPEASIIAPVDTVNEQRVFRAFDADNNLLGYAIETDELGFGGLIKMMVGIDVNGNLVNYSILSHSETPGLGSKMDKWFIEKSPITGISVSSAPLSVSKDGGSVDAITAATISSRAFLSAINKAIATYNVCVQSENEVTPTPDMSIRSNTLDTIDNQEATIPQDSLQNIENQIVQQ